MALQTIDVGTVANDRTGDTWRDAFVKINSNIAETQDFLDAAGFTFISQESDFPTQTASTITLEAKIIYVITGAFTTAKNFLCEDSAVWTSFNQRGDIVTYSGSGAMFSGTNVSFTIAAAIINCPSAEAFTFTDTVVNTRVFKLENVTIISCNKVGTFTGMANPLFILGSAPNANDGITYAGTNLIAATVDRMFFASTSASFIALDFGTATIQNIEVEIIMIAPAGAIGLSGAAGSANVPTGFLGMMANSSFSGGMTAILSGIAVDDFRWTFRDNTPLADTVQDALLSFNGSSTATVISTQNVPVIVNATWTCVRESLFTCTTGGRATSLSERDLSGVPITVSVGLISSGGGTIDVTVYLAVNGSVVTDSATSIQISGSKQAFVTIPWQETIENIFFYEVFVENNTNTTNIIVESGKLRIR